jgi:hypothetical protein
MPIEILPAWAGVSMFFAVILTVNGAWREESSGAAETFLFLSGLIRR